ncbi:pyridoxamine 5'-phosphate oxidase family protein [Mycobacterium sherrisii]|uniref:Pyridoxamine 5'-phosphate oxidase n=1 Tax=Mycobacterium sherrisii TaxID=243061 RepID=A0A1E3T0Q1_9MYCO|nr:pyridoxamine 5'-phosphate oxidase family protein [Mycobacterium sherrisii]MCV7028227.1 pyridoxamine 5'-phosphate oxidase family protein [Mycobacterium sherrisii]MEC4765394.1 pyridoxamine 5'-phosphate oxidase family protein [Mycobacterium sherrisii]ODR07931.1 pyridoxamine 5'-phosphate oxidase [Mycobacterium sherrisii]ORW77832.1 pyridoxamine 5'-phosphate oxidase [Mycobacterium sherrisii]
MAVTGFHEGELAAQRRAGVEAAAKRLENMLRANRISAGATQFLSTQRFAALTGRDYAGVLWISPIAGPPGFLRGADDVVQISRVPRAGDPLHRIAAGQQVGLIAVDFATRRRVRVNGTLLARDDTGMAIGVEQAYGNCPQYIHRRDVNVPALANHGTPTHATALSAVDQTMITNADTFFLGTTHPRQGSDASHRGGAAGFVRVDSPTRLWWPDYPGNNMFNSLGNLMVDDEAALLFVDFDTGASIQLSGSAQVQWSIPEADDAAGRGVAFQIDSVVTSAPVV